MSVTSLHRDEILESVEDVALDRRRRLLNARERVQQFSVGKWHRDSRSE